MNAHSEIKIDKNIPLPRASKKRTVYPFQSLAVGESFFVPGRTPATISGSRQYAERATGHRFISRSVDENGKNGVRVWRVA